MMNECRICKADKLLNTVEIEEEDYKWEIQVCTNCWGAVAAVANRAMARRLEALETKLQDLGQALEEYYIASK